METGLVLEALAYCVPPLLGKVMCTESQGFSNNRSSLAHTWASLQSPLLGIPGLTWKGTFLVGLFRRPYPSLDQGRFPGLCTLRGAAEPLQDVEAAQYCTNPSKGVTSTYAFETIWAAFPGRGNAPVPQSCISQHRENSARGEVIY